jgi:hypothetical protein
MAFMKSHPPEKIEKLGNKSLFGSSHIRIDFKPLISGERI